ncbi:hypothetical protein NE237_025631 [Protea cynaroides]|uniref:Uncharacterized protein n=1 Tax=Protea cynaroides TaxID=273540 RepID=A0A9Q0K1I3_9MAGN|nr:hypothetical protein NE237_025631 [Protea cynaroides]
MENRKKQQWHFKSKQELITASDMTIRWMLNKLMGELDATDPRPMIHLGRGDPSESPCFRTTQVAEDAIVDAVRSAKFNGYAPVVGILPARRLFESINGCPNIFSDPAAFIQVSIIPRHPVFGSVGSSSTRTMIKVIEIILPSPDKQIISTNFLPPLYLSSSASPSSRSSTTSCGTSCWDARDDIGIQAATRFMRDIPPTALVFHQVLKAEEVTGTRQECGQHGLVHAPKQSHPQHLLVVATWK